MKYKLFLTIILVFGSVYAQKKTPYSFGKMSQADFDLTTYQKDSSANAVFLFEYGQTSFHENNDFKIIIRTKYYAKIKIFNKEGEKNATIKIPIYHNKGKREQVLKIRAITHNGLEKTELNPKHVFTIKNSDKWSEVKFTMPNLKPNSVIEYEYTFETPYIFNFIGWKFQSEIPKIYSGFYASIPGNYVYNRRLIGYYQLATNESKIKKRCFYVSGVAGHADCEDLTYTMNDIPAFIKEDYMTTKENYLSAIKFELSEYRGFDGHNQKFTKSWNDVDKEFKTEKSVGKQLKKIDYIKKQLPQALLIGENTIVKAKSIYYYIQNHFTWNEKYRLFREVNIKDAYSQKTGNSTEINIVLINALNSAGFDTEIMLISTRNNGLPTKAHPILTDFNYAIAKLNIGDKVYLLDATNKLLPFNILPYRALNSYGRVMNFKKGSYWYDIKVQKRNSTLTSLNLTLNDEGNFKGFMQQSYNGYKAINKRNEIEELDEDEYLTKIEDGYNGDANLIINSYKNSNLDSIEKPLKELFDITIDSELNSKYLLISPFIVEKISNNPFKLKERSYPIDFGYPRTSQFTFKLEIPEQYQIKELPKRTSFSLPNKGGTYLFDIQQRDNDIMIISRIVLKKAFYNIEEYPYLKEFYNQIIKTQKSLITLEKIN